MSITVTQPANNSALTSSVVRAQMQLIADAIPNFADEETPAGDIDGMNTVFTLAETPNPVGSLELFLNGALQQRGADYTLSGTTITFVTAPPVGPGVTSVLLAWYRYV